MVRAIFLIVSAVLFADKNAAFNNFNLFDTFFPHDFERHPQENSASVKVGLGRVKKSDVENQRTLVSANVNFGLQDYGLGQLEMFWGGKWNEFSSVLNYDFRAHHIGAVYSDTLPQDSVWKISGLFHILDAKEPDLTNTGVDLGAGWFTDFGGVKLQADGNFFIRIDEDILASLGDSTIRRLKLRTGLEFDINEDSKLGAGVTGESGKLGPVNLRRIVPDLSYRFYSLGPSIIVRAEYQFTHTEDDAYLLYPLMPILTQSGNTGRFMKASVAAEIDLGFMFSMYPEISWIELGGGGWQASLEMIVPFQ